MRQIASRIFTGGWTISLWTMSQDELRPKKFGVGEQSISLD